MSAATTSVVDRLRVRCGARLGTPGETTQAAQDELELLAFVEVQLRYLQKLISPPKGDSIPALERWSDEVDRRQRAAIAAVGPLVERRS